MKQEIKDRIERSMDEFVSAITDFADGPHSSTVDDSRNSAADDCQDMNEALFPITDNSAPAGPAPIVVRRSEVQSSAECQAQGFAVHHGLVSTNSQAADIGQAIHDVIATMVKDRSENGTAPNDLRDKMREAAARTRPDLQPFVLDRLWCIYKIVDLVCSNETTGERRHEEDLEIYDGGEGAHAGQLEAVLIPAIDGTPAVHITGEIDLMMRTVSEEEVDVIDWKSGRTEHSATSVKTDFQFTFYAVLIFINFPKVNRIRFRVFMVAKGEMTGVFVFKREDFYNLHKRVLSAVEIHLAMLAAKSLNEVTATPSPEKCRICPFVTKCPEVSQPIGELLAAGDEALLRRLVVLDADADEIRGILKDRVKSVGQDMVFGDVAFGQHEPKETAPRAKPCKVYTPAAGQSESPEPSPRVGKNKRVKFEFSEADMMTVDELAKRGISAPVTISATNDQATKLRELAAADQAQARELEAIAKLRREQIAAIVGESWEVFVQSWRELLGGVVSGSDFTAGVTKLVAAIAKTGSEHKISKQTRATWVAASLDGKLNWLTGKVVV